MNEEEIIELIKNKQYSRLSFLEDQELLNNNENYYGFLYFLLDSKSEDTSEVLKQIIDKHNSPSKAYEYLGNIAEKIFNQFGQEYVASSFFRLSIQCDKNNSKAWWGLYLTDKDCKAFLESLKIDYNNKDITVIKNKLKNTDFLVEIDYSINDWKKLIEIIFNSDLSNKDYAKKYLILAYFYLERFDEGINLINSLDKVHANIIYRYYNLGKINRDTVCSKLSSYEIEKIFTDDYSLIYKETLKEYDLSPKLVPL